MPKTPWIAVSIHVCDGNKTHTESVPVALINHRLNSEGNKLSVGASAIDALEIALQRLNDPPKKKPSRLNVLRPLFAAFKR